MISQLKEIVTILKISILTLHTYMPQFVISGFLGRLNSVFGERGDIVYYDVSNYDVQVSYV